MIRVCRKCHKNSEEVRFYDPNSVSGKAAGSMCQPCWVESSITWRKNNKDRFNRGRHAKSLLKKFGISKEEFDRLYADPVCVGCRSKWFTQRSTNKRLVLDHDHATGKARGLLCHDCNRTIATAHDNPQILIRLARYLYRYQKA